MTMSGAKPLISCAEDAKRRLLRLVSLMDRVIQGGGKLAERS
jgi:hypothetical protein